MWRLSDEEYIEVLAPFLGIAFACAFSAIFFGHTELVYATLAILILLIVRARPLLFLGRLICGALAFVGNAVVVLILAFLYLTVISAYAVFFRSLSTESVRKFWPAHTASSSFLTVNKPYTKNDLEKTW